MPYFIIWGVGGGAVSCIIEQEVFCLTVSLWNVFVLVAEGPGGVGGPNSGKSVPTIFHLL